MKKLLIGVLMGFLFLGAAAHRSYADACGCGGPDGMAMRQGMMHHGSGPMHGPKRTGRFLWKKLLQLGLTDKQMDALKAIRMKEAKEKIRKKADLELTRVDLRELLGRDSVDMIAVEANLKKAESLRTDLRLSRIRAMEDIKAVLTPEQRAKFKEEMRTGFMKKEGMCSMHGAPAHAGDHEAGHEAGGK